MKVFQQQVPFKRNFLYHTSLRDVSTVEPLVLPDLRYRKLTKFQKSGLLLFRKISLVGISRKEMADMLDFSADLELSKNWQTDTGLLMRGTGNIILTAAYIENKVNEKSNLLKVYPMGALEFKYPLIVKNEAQKSEVFIPIAQLVYSTDTSSSVDPIDEDSSTTEFDSSTLFKLRKIPGIDRQEEGLRLNTGFQYFYDYK